MPDNENSKPDFVFQCMVDLGRLALAGGMTALLLAVALPQIGSAQKGPGAKPPEIAGQEPLDGRKMTQTMNCRSCHIIEGEGGTIGPPLDGLGTHRTKSQIEQRLSKSQKVKTALPPYLTPQEMMSHIRLPEPQAQAISLYLSKLPETKLRWDASRHKGDAADSIPAGSHFTPRKADTASEKGKQLYFEHGCAACHTIGAGGGHIGPTLEGVGARRSRNFIESRITNGALLGPTRSGEYKNMGYRMPPATVSKKEVSDITNFLLTIPVGKESAHTKE